MVRALRTLPMYERERLRYSCQSFVPLPGHQLYQPHEHNAWPVSIRFPEIKAFGCCHEVFGTQKVLAAIASQELRTGPIDRKDIRSKCWESTILPGLTLLPYEGADLFPVYKSTLGHILRRVTTTLTVHGRIHL